MIQEEYRRKALEPIVNYIKSALDAYGKEEIEARLKAVLPIESKDARIINNIIQIVKASAKYCAEVGSRPEVQMEALEWLERNKWNAPIELPDDFERALELFLINADYTSRTYAEDAKAYSDRLREIVRKEIAPGWKPTKEQIDAVKRVKAAIGPGPLYDQLGLLLDDLKKLM